MAETSEDTDSLDQFLKIDRSDLEIWDIIGRGAHGKVHRASWLGCEVAVKVSPRVNNYTPKDGDFLKELPHPHIVQLLGYCVDDDYTYLVMELMETDLNHTIHNYRLAENPSMARTLFTDSEALDIITKLALGLRFLHERGVVHRDLKSSNILVHAHPGYIDVKVTDFGVSEHFRDLSHDQATGTRGWRAPEVLQSRRDQSVTYIAPAIDVYSFAMTCYEIVTGKDLFQDEFVTLGPRMTWHRIVSEGLRPELPIGLDSTLAELIRRCWRHDPQQRPNCNEICKELATMRPVRARADAQETHAPRWTEQHESSDGQSIGTRSGDKVEIFPRYLEIDADALKLVRVIGEGGCSKVYEATWLGCAFAAKRFRTSQMPELQREMELLVKLLHPHVVRLVGFSVEEEGGWIVMELMEQNLQELIASRIRLQGGVVNEPPSPPFSESEALKIITKIALGMRFLHSKGVAHRDLTSRNVMATDHTDSIDVKIVDFGLSRFIGNSVVTAGGTGFWRSPEILRQPMADIDYDLKSADVYSFAMNCYEVLTGKEPFADELQTFPDRASLKSSIVSGDHLRPVLPDDLSPTLAKLIRSCWHDDPQQRPTFTQICSILILPDPKHECESTTSDYRFFNSIYRLFAAIKNQFTNCTQTPLH
jgi:serine/threonine protein kinase